MLPYTPYQNYLIFEKRPLSLARLFGGLKFSRFFFCNELVRTTCGKSTTKLKVRQSLGFKEDIDGLRLEKKRANNLKFNKFLLLLLYY